jgi:hypothetical protein
MIGDLATHFLDAKISREGAYVYVIAREVLECLFRRLAISSAFDGERYAKFVTFQLPVVKVAVRK